MVVFEVSIGFLEDLTPVASQWRGDIIRSSSVLSVAAETLVRGERLETGAMK